MAHSGLDGRGARAGGGVVLGAATLAVVVWAAPVSPSASAKAKEPEAHPSVAWLRSGSVELGVLPPLGGRVVMLRMRGGENLLASDPKYWRAPFPVASLDLAFQPWNGRIVWVGPQSGFWSQQDLAPERKSSHAGWPPDPYNEAARFETVEKTETRLVLRGPVSPVTGLTLEHGYEITGERTVRMSVKATNGRDTPVSWDLWPNTRVRPDGHPYVPIDPAHPPRVDIPGGGAAGAYPHEEREGWLMLPPGHHPEPPARRLTAKAFVHPVRGLIAYFRGRDLLLIRAPHVAPASLHPEQAAIEIYRGAGPSPADDLLELEMHSAYTTLPPGGVATFEQTFEVLDYAGPDDAAGHLARLSRLPR